MQRYYITDRAALGGSIQKLLRYVRNAAESGVEYIQLREKTLPDRALLELAKQTVDTVRDTGARALINGRVDVALAAGAHGVHLPSSAIRPVHWRAVVPRDFLIAVSTHSVAELLDSEGADFAVFGPIRSVQGKAPPKGWAGLASATAASPIPVFALGGLHWEDTDACRIAGAAGMASIRLFQAG